MSHFYDFGADNWGPEEIAALQEVIESRQFTMSSQVKAFERAFAEYHGREHAVMVNSGSSANLVSIAALSYRQERPLRPGDEVIVPGISWSTTYAPLQQYGLKLRFVDVDLETLNVDPELLEAAITDRTRAIVAVSILGNPAPLDVMRRLCDERGLVFMEDNCESLGARLDGQLTGTFGDINTFSFFFSHQLSTGEGGMVLTDDRELADLARAVRAHGWTRDLEPDSPIFQRSADDFHEAYRFLLPGYNVRPMEFAAAVGRVQIRRLDESIAARRANLEHFQGLFQDDERFIIQRENGESSSFSFTIVLHPEVGASRREVMEQLAAHGIAYRIITGGCFTRHDAIRHFDHDVAGTLENAEYAHDRGFFVGNSPRDLRPQLDRLYEILDSVCKPELTSSPA